MDIKRILRNYNFEKMPFFRCHEEYFAALEDLENLWKKFEPCTIGARLTIIYDKKYHTTTCTSDDDKKTVIFSILVRFPSLLADYSKFEENFQKLRTQPSSNTAPQKRSHFRVVRGFVLHSGNSPKRIKFPENLGSSCDT